MILFLILFLIILNLFLKRKDNKYDLFPIITILLILYAGLKYKYGYDYNNYLINFNEINTFSDAINTNFEKGYSLILFLFKSIGLGFHSFLLFIAFISIKMKTNMIKKFSVLPEVSLLIYFLLFYINNDVEQIRHGISIGFCFYALRFMLEDDMKSKIFAILFIIFGVLFHTSALLFIPIYFIKDRVISDRQYVIIFVTSLLFSFVNIFDVLILLNKTFIHSTYLTSKINIYLTEKQSIINLSLLIKLFILIVFYYFAFDKKNKVHRLLFNTYFVGIIFTCIFNSIPILTARGTIYMRYCELFMIPIYINSIKEQKNKKIHYCLISCIFAYYLIKFLTMVMKPEYFNYLSI